VRVRASKSVGAVVSLIERSTDDPYNNAARRENLDESYLTSDWFVFAD
jgi:hypothetical protein